MLSQDQELYGTRVQDILYITHARHARGRCTSVP